MSSNDEISNLLNETVLTDVIGKNLAVLEGSAVDLNVGLGSSVVDAAATVDVTGTTGIYWNEQNDETFLQNLFANTTLLNDDFGKNSDFDCLGFDNLQLSYDHTSDLDSATVNNSNTSAVIDLQPQLHHSNSFVDNTSEQLLVIQELNLNNQSSSSTTTIESSSTSLPNLLIEECKQLTLLSSSEIHLINSNTTTTNSNNKSDTGLFTLQPVYSANNQLVNQSNEDDKIFKKPSNHLLFNQQKIDFSSGTSYSNTDFTVKVPANKQQKQISKKEHSIKNPQKEKKQQQQSQTTANGSKKEKSLPISIIPSLTSAKSLVEAVSLSNATSTSSNTFSSPITKILTLKRSRKRSKLLNQATGQHSNNSSTNLKLSNSNEEVLPKSRVKSNSKLFLQNHISSKKSDLHSKKDKSSTNKTQKFINLISTNLEPLSKKFASDQDAPCSLTKPANTVTIIQSEDNNSQSSLTRNLSNSSLINLKNLKKDEVDLHIKELSLLDLHSSEDDSAEFLIKKNSSGNNILQQTQSNNLLLSSRLKKNIRSSSNDINTLVHSPPQLSAPFSSSSSIPNTNSNNNNNYLNEIISKRIKYSPASSVSSAQVEDQNSNKDENGVDKFIQYLSKSLEPDNTSLSQNLSENNSVQQSVYTRPILIQDNSQSSIKYKKNLIQPQSGSSLKSQYKRKKNDNSNPSNITLNSTNSEQTTNNPPVILISVSSNGQTPAQISTPSQIQLTSIPLNKISSDHAKNDQDSNINIQLSAPLSLDNDTLQHMKDLDINNDLNVVLGTNARDIINENSQELYHGNTSSSSSSNFKSLEEENCSNIKLNLNDAKSRNYLWNLLKSHSTLDELVNQFGSMLHDKISFWDLVQLKLKFSQNNHLKTTYEIIDDYTILYSNMSNLLEKFVREHSSNGSNSSSSLSSSYKKNENSSRSRSSSRNCRKQSTSSTTK